MTVSTILAGKGHEVVSVEPNASLADAVPIEMVDIFRASTNAGAAVDEDSVFSLPHDQS